MDCIKCGKEAVKYGKLIKNGQEVQRYHCRVCGYVFWEGQQQREMSDNPGCPKCGKKTNKAGTGIKGGQKVKRYRCGSCGYVFLGEKE